MDFPSSTAKPRRSRAGCHNCRRLHRKCDEAKPSCFACRASQTQCVYGMRISWGGRPFKKSTFGQCLDQSAAIVPITSEYEGNPCSPGCLVDVGTPDRSFVYGIAAAHYPPNISYTEAQSSHNIDYAASPSPTESPPSLPFNTGEILQNPSYLPHLVSSHRLLLDHFLHTVTRSFSLHLNSHHGFCTTYLTMALDASTRVLPAILEASAHHRRSLGLHHDERELISLRHESLRNFIVPAIGQDSATDDQAVARALMLCLCEILAGGEKTNSWKIHLQGAIAMLRQKSGMGRQNGVSKQISAHQNFLRRWCESLDVLSLMGPTAASDVEMREEVDSDYIDEFHGFSRGLIPVIREAHLLLVERQLLQEALTQCDGQSQQASLWRLSHVGDERCRKAIRNVKSSLYRRPHTFHPSIQSFISPQIQSDFIAINEAYHHAVLLQLYRRVQNLPYDDPAVEASTEAILINLYQVELRDEACPGVAMLQPLFDAGCATIRQSQRTQVVDMMNNLEKRYAMGNVSRARTFLQEYWLEWDCQRAQAGDLHWDIYLKQKGWDLSLY